MPLHHRDLVGKGARLAAKQRQDRAPAFGSVSAMASAWKRSVVPSLIIRLSARSLSSITPNGAKSAAVSLSSLSSCIYALSGNKRRNAKAGNPFHLRAGRFKLGLGVIGDTRFKGLENVVLAEALDGDDERKPEIAHVARIELGEAGMLLLAQPVEPGACLFRGRFRSQLSGNGQLPARSGCARSTPRRSSGLAARNSAHSASWTLACRQRSSNAAVIVGALRDPGRMFENAAIIAGQTQAFDHLSASGW
jgi:hypothetical protein